jgi:hypothetical protein
MGVFDGCAPGGKNAIWKLTVNFQMLSDDLGANVELKRIDIHRQHCILRPFLAGEKPPCSDIFTDSIGNPDHAMKGLTTYLPYAKGRAAAASAAIAFINANADAVVIAAAPCVLLLPAPLVPAPAGNEIKIILPPPPPPAKTKKKRKKATLCNNASTATPPPPTSPDA